jgi:hypothetical protein
MDPLEQLIASIVAAVAYIGKLLSELAGILN